ncbi:hypothetical protein [Dermacoccus nishinomiyaensis]|uniref:hypothetical protein n=1 Tax=Dermacoccus nishinomiyaensis TaxID=1274 RepID=UPI001EF594BD|nr:hypothetical protein [Dermacoccus nishinomiyaensis]MCG7428748.1 hypothetical protein [Dermacoccus nishinomiyaensis]
MTMTQPFLLVRARAGQHTSLLEVTFADGLFRLASTRGASVHAAEDVVSAVLQLVVDAPPDADADLVVIGCLDEVATPCLIAARRGGEWCDVGFDDATRDWFDVRAEVVAALVGLHAQSGAPSGCLAAGDAQDEMRPDAGWVHAA